MRILWLSNAAFTNTGYGVGTKQVVTQLNAHGHDTAVLAYYGLEGAQLYLDGIEHFPKRSDAWGNDVLADYMAVHRADLAIIHRDIWVNDKSLAEQLPVAAWFPIDSLPLRRIMTEQMDKHRWMATMSRWAIDAPGGAKENGYNVEYMPHSFDPTVYKPFDGDRAELRARLYEATPGMMEDDAFIMLIVGANKSWPSRKGFPEMFEAAGRYMRQNPKAYLHVHSLITSEHGGPNLLELAQNMGIPLNRLSLLNPFVFFRGLEPEELAMYYQSADVLLNCSYGEGFGIPILEAQACGIPVVTTNWSSMPELTFNGRCVEGKLSLQPLMAYWKIPDVDGIYDAIESIEQSPDRPLGRHVAEELVNLFSDAAVYKNYWTPWLERIERDLLSGAAGSVRFD